MNKEQQLKEKLKQALKNDKSHIQRLSEN